MKGPSVTKGLSCLTREKVAIAEEGGDQEARRRLLHLSQEDPNRFGTPPPEPSQETGTRPHPLPLQQQRALDRAGRDNPPPLQDLSQGWGPWVAIAPAEPQPHQDPKPIAVLQPKRVVLPACDEIPDRHNQSDSPSNRDRPALRRRAYYFQQQMDPVRRQLRLPHQASL